LPISLARFLSIAIAIDTSTVATLEHLVPSLKRAGGNFSVNYLLLFPDELASDGRSAVLAGPRARYACEQHELVQDLEVRVSILDCGQGRGRVASANAERVCLEVELQRTEMHRTPICAVVGVSRPQTVKKVLQVAAMVGFEELCFVRAERSVQSYLGSKPMQDPGQKQELYKALEQSGDWRLPRISVVDDFRKFRKETLEKLLVGREGFIASTRAPLSARLPSLWRPGTAHALLAVGPEAGWTCEEVDAFEQAGVRPISLGERCYRVEIALSLLTGQLQTLLEQR
jgi:RsmE family RNA methyltransferase